MDGAVRGEMTRDHQRETGCYGTAKNVIDIKVFLLTSKLNVGAMVHMSE